MVSIKKHYPGQGKQVAAAALSCRYLNNVWVVDDDIDVRNHVQVEWAYTIVTTIGVGF